MKKSHRHDELSDAICLEVGCEKHIKARLAAKGFTRCYYHWCVKESTRGHYVNAAPRKKRIVKGLPVKDFK